MSEGDKGFFLQGSLFKTIFIFSLPLIFTNLLQVLFSFTDVAVLGRFASAESMGSVGSVAILVFMCTGFLTGIGSGVNSVAAFYIGADNKKSVSDTVHTSAILCVTAGVAVCVSGIPRRVCSRMSPLTAFGCHDRGAHTVFTFSFKVI